MVRTAHSPLLVILLTCPSKAVIKTCYLPPRLPRSLAVVLQNSVAGGLLCQVMYSLLLLPLGTVQPLLSHLLVLLEQLNDFNRLLPETGRLEEQELRTEALKTSSGQWECLQTLREPSRENVDRSCSDNDFFCCSQK